MASRIALALTLCVVGLSTPAAAQLRSVELYAPRAFGYVLGDTIALSVDIVIDAPFTLDTASLPRPRALNYWLDLTDVVLKDKGTDEGAQRYGLDLTYQTFYAPLEPRRLDIPPLQLAATHGDRRIEIGVPAWSFLMSPLREIVSTARGAAIAPRPDIAPALIPTGGTLRWLLIALAGAVLALIILAWQLGWGPFVRRKARPFARAAKAVRRNLPASVRAPAPPAYREALLALHRAFNVTAGKGVFAEDLPRFFTEYPAFSAAEDEVKRLFAASRRLFFSEDMTAAAHELSSVELVAIANRLRAVERGSA